ncbi:hypothetical protein OXX69_005369 [Metschnikowia pulcherrima]
MSSDDESSDTGLRSTPQNQSTSGYNAFLKDPYSRISQVLPSSPIQNRSVCNSSHEVSRDPLAPIEETSSVSPNISFSKISVVQGPEVQKSPSAISSVPGNGNMKRASYLLDEMSDSIEYSSPMKSPPSTKPKKKAKTKASETDARSNKAWKDANKVVRRKQDIMSEMVMEIAFCLDKKLRTGFFTNIFLLPSVRNSYLEIPLISWKRRVSARYNKEEDFFVPCDLTEQTEKVLILFYEPDELIEKLKNGVVETHIDHAKRRARSEDPSKEYFVLIMVPNFSTYLRKLETNENRQYRAKTLQRLNRTPSSSRPSNEITMTVAQASKLLVESEVRLGVNIFTTKTVEESIEWLHSFTYTIGSSIYDKYERNPDFSAIGTIKSGANPKGTFLEMVKKFNLMTEPKAENLYQYYASPLSLYKRLVETGELGAVKGRNVVPPSVNKMMKSVFTSKNPNAVITD